jgi:MprA protease rhombosortase-interaction domain-containing protein
MYHLASMFPAVRRFRLPLSRDQAMLLMLATNELLLGLETYIAHLISGTIVPNEWIPILFGPISGVLLLLAGLLALRRRNLATVIATLVFLASATVGLLGAYFHLVRAARPFAPAGEQVSVPLLVWAPPILGPLTFALVGLLGISAAWIEDPPDSGQLVLLGGRRIKLPYSKTRAYFFAIGMGSLATVISSVLDHARTDFSNPWLWFPTAVGVFATVVAVVLGALDHPSRGDLFTYTAAMLLMLLVGVLGSILHIDQNLTSEGVIIGERFLRGAPFLAPLLFADIGTLGLIVLLDPKERQGA